MLLKKISFNQIGKKGGYTLIGKKSGGKVKTSAISVSQVPFGYSKSPLEK